MYKGHRLSHLLGPALRHRRLELGITDGTIFRKYHLKILTIEKTSDLRDADLMQLCKYYQWSLSQLFDELEFLDKIQKMA